VDIFLYVLVLLFALACCWWVEWRKVRHWADYLIDFVVTILPSYKMVLEFRRKSASNKWTVTIDKEGTLGLHEVVRGVSTTVALANKVVSNGDRVNILVEDNIIRAWVENEHKIAYDQAHNFKNVTVAPEFVAQGMIFDPVVWPRKLTDISIVEALARAEIKGRPGEVVQLPADWDIKPKRIG
jgi:hypothetical protein